MRKHLSHKGSFCLLAAVLSGFALASAGPAAAQGTPPAKAAAEHALTVPAKENKALLQNFYDEVLNAKHMDAIDKFVAADAVDHAAMPGQAPGLAGVKQMLNMYLTAFPDLHTKVEDMIAEGDKVVARITMTGTQKGEFMGVAPTGKKIDITGIDIVRFAKGKMVEHWGNEDDLGMMQQLGVVPPPGTPAEKK